MKHKIRIACVMFIASIAFASTDAWSASTNATTAKPAAPAKGAASSRDAAAAPKDAVSPKRTDFDHLLTGFPLTGAHAQTPCETCHVGGRFVGTPKRCAECHSPASRIAAISKPAGHMQTNEPCEQCHRSAILWSGARFSHATVATGTCARCHDGNQASGKPGNHVVTTASCDTCHRTMAWLPALAGGALPANHRPIPAGSACTACHIGGNFAFTHPNTTTGCVSCHNNSTAIGKPGTAFHTQVSNSNTCETCHKSTSSFTVVTFSHTGVTPGQCANCHNGANPPAEAKSPTHFVTTQSCDKCHGTAAWTPVRAYAHTSPYYRTHNSGVICTDCHTNNSEVATWTSAAYKPDCAGCHASRFKPDAHKKVDSPAIFYTVSELRNCAGSCHEYTDSTFSTVKKTRNGQHRSTDGSF